MGHASLRVMVVIMLCGKRDDGHQEGAEITECSGRPRPTAPFCNKGEADCKNDKRSCRKNLRDKPVGSLSLTRVALTLRVKLRRHEIDTEENDSADVGVHASACSGTSARHADTINREHQLMQLLTAVDVITSLAGHHDGA